MFCEITPQKNTSKSIRRNIYTFLNHFILKENKIKHLTSTVNAHYTVVHSGANILKRRHKWSKFYLNIRDEFFCYLEILLNLLCLNRPVDNPINGYDYITASSPIMKEDMRMYMLEPIYMWILQAADCFCSMFVRLCRQKFTHTIFFFKFAVYFRNN